MKDSERLVGVGENAELDLEGRQRDRSVLRKPRPAFGGIGGVKGHNMKEITLPGSPALWAGASLALSPQPLPLRKEELPWTES